MTPNVRERLHEAAALPAAPLDVDRVERRGRRRRWAQGLAATGLGVVLVAGAIAYSTPGGTTESDVADRCDGAPHDLTVYLMHSANEHDVGHIQRYLENHRDVEAAVYVSKEQAYEEFERQHPGFAWASLPPDALPASFRVDVSPDTAMQGIAQQLRSLKGVDAVLAKPESMSDSDGCD